MLLMTTLLLTAVNCGQQSTSQVKRDATTVDRIFAPVNIGDSDIFAPGNNRAENSAVDLWEIFLASAVAGINSVKSITSRQSFELMPAHASRYFPVALNELKINEIVTHYETGLKSLTPTTTGTINIIYIDTKAATLADQIKTVGARSTALYTPPLSAGELRWLEAAEKNLDAYTASHKVTVQFNAGHLSSARLEKSLNTMMNKDIHLKKAVMTTVDRPVMSTTTKIVSRMIYVFIFADITNDVYQGFDQAHIGWIGRN